MARANFVQKAQKDYPAAGIKKGESYYWWKFRYGGKHMSKVRPKPSQLTQSSYLSQAMAIQERIEELTADDTLQGEVEDIISSLRDLASECDDNKSNMPEGLQEGDTGQLLEQRTESCNEAADELESIDLSEFEEDEEQRDDKDCPDCNGKGRELDADGEETGNDCPTCEGTGQVKDEESEPKNSDGQTEQEYWEAKLEEVQGVSFNIE